MRTLHSALVQPAVVTSQDAVKESPFGAMIPPTTTIPGSFMASAIPGAGLFNPVGVQSQQAAADKAAQSADAVDAAAELTLQGDVETAFARVLSFSNRSKEASTKLFR